jgi:hypothetical protein
MLNNQEYITVELEKMLYKILYLQEFVHDILG